jgi:hypothetical protein
MQIKIKSEIFNNVISLIVIFIITVALMFFVKQTNKILIVSIMFIFLLIYDLLYEGADIIADSDGITIENPFRIWSFPKFYKYSDIDFLMFNYLKTGHFMKVFF